MKYTTIRVLKKTRDRLAKRGGKDDNFDDIINQLCYKVKK